MPALATTLTRDPRRRSPDATVGAAGQPDLCVPCLRADAYRPNPPRAPALHRPTGRLPRTTRRRSAPCHDPRRRISPPRRHPPAPSPPRWPPGQKLTQDALERHLWSAADILRGSIDSSDYKNFIFGLLFLKRLSDRFDAECAAVKKEGGNPEDPDEHEFFVPKRARWRCTRRRDQLAFGAGRDAPVALP